MQTFFKFFLCREGWPCETSPLNRKVGKMKSFQEVLAERLLCSSHTTTFDPETRDPQTSAKPSRTSQHESVLPLWLSVSSLLEDFQGPRVAGNRGPCKAYPAPPPRVAPDHCLNSAQKLGLEFFLCWGEVLPGNFRRHQLKRAFRRLALRLHPDRRADGRAQFEALRGHFESLSQVFACDR